MSHLQAVDEPPRPRTLNSRREIELWLAERRRVLDALVKAERSGRASSPTRIGEGELALDVEDAA